jgi:hypothetical protein
MKPNFPDILMLDYCGKPTDVVALPQLLLPRNRLRGSCAKPTGFGWMAATAKREQMDFHATGCI